MDYVIFFAWLTFLSLALTRIKFVTSSGISAKIIVAVFLCKVAAGMAAGWITRLDVISDTWDFHKYGLEEYRLLLSNPKEYFTNLFSSGYSDPYAGVFQNQNSYWNDLKMNLMLKLVSVMHIFSFGNYYTNVILYNFLAFFGGISLYRVFKMVYRISDRLLIPVIFLLPSLLYFGSTIHKEGLMFAAIGVIVFNIYYLIHFPGSTIKRVLFILFSLLLIFLFRNFIVFAMLPALAAWVIASRTKIAAIKIFALVYVTAMVLFFGLQYIIPSVNPPAYMAKKQADFLKLEKGNTSIVLDTLRPTVAGYVKSMPQAMQHALLRPFVTDVAKSKLLLPLSAELVLYQLLLLTFLFTGNWKSIISSPFSLFCLFFAISVYLTIGYTVPVIGAIVRYRSIYLPFLLAPFLFNMKWIIQLRNN